MISSPSPESTFSLSRARKTILTAHASADAYRRHADILMDAIVAAEACLQVCQADGSASEQQALVSAIRHLSRLMIGGAT